MLNLNFPNIKDLDPAELFNLFKNEKVMDLIKSTQTPKYLCWDKIKYKAEGLKDISPEHLWGFIKVQRSFSLGRRKTVIQDEQGKFFTWMTSLPQFEIFFHEVDLKLGGRISLTPNSLKEMNRDKDFISHGIMEEAIASSQLEGASTTRKVAKAMILENRVPKTYDEKMIYNNYLAMKFIKDSLVEEDLSVDVLLELHSLITKATLENEDEEGRFRNENEKIVVSDSITGEIYHEAPNIKFVKKEIQKFIDYANDKIKDETFIHPVIKAITLHFWMGYLHPFTDGNGRIARAIFYWYLLKNDYWGFGYLPLSMIIKKSPIEYGKSYIYTERDDNDLTYFLDYNIRKIQQAIVEFEGYVLRKEKENMKMRSISKITHNLNMRQIRLLQYFYKNREASITIKTHMSINQIARGTAISDLKDLQNQLFLEVKMMDRSNHYFSTEKIKTLFG